MPLYCLRIYHIVKYLPLSFNISFNFCELLMQLITTKLLENLSREARKNDRLRINFNFHSSLDDKCQRLLNAMEPGTIMPIHKHKVAEIYIVLRGIIEVSFYDDSKNIIDTSLIDPAKGIFGVQIPEDTWHSLIVMKSGTVIFEVKEGPYIPHEIGGILE